MTTLQLLIVCVTALVLALIGAVVCVALASNRSRGVQVAPGTEVVVHTLDRRSVRGTVTSGDPTRDAISLAEAAYLVDGKAEPMGGVVTVPAANVALTQAL